MSLSLEDVSSTPFAFIINQKGKQVGIVSYCEDDTNGVESIELEPGFKFQLSPEPSKEELKSRTLFVAGESGAGKSYFVKQYAERYHKEYPKHPIYLISYLEQDETLDSFKPITRINAFTQEVLDECLSWDLKEEFSNCFIIFDDIDSVVNKKTKEIIYGFLNKILRIGRHSFTSCAYVGHALYGSNELKQILNECMTITFFPKYLNYKKMKYLLENYFGLSKEQIEKVKSIRDRSATFIKGADKIILTDTRCFLLN
ncbi:MAG: hypothetical protein EOO43_01245 [Flavobacterium sp.]|nr:MAG: hypothetical protein EOO43_01245 [Flavobacterium sp.]